MKPLKHFNIRKKKKKKKNPEGCAPKLTEKNGGSL